MASWTDQSTDGLLPGEPWTSAKALASFENPQAIAEGASGAPKVRTAALQPPTAGSIRIAIIDPFGGGFVASTDYVLCSCVVLVPGTIRVVLTNISYAGVSNSIELRKNGTAFTTYNFGTTGLQFSDVSVALGDHIDIFLRESTGATGGGTGEVRIESGTADLAVA